MWWLSFWCPLKTTNKGCLLKKHTLKMETADVSSKLIPRLRLFLIACDSQGIQEHIMGMCRMLPSVAQHGGGVPEICPGVRFCDSSRG